MKERPCCVIPNIEDVPGIIKLEQNRRFRLRRARCDDGSRPIAGKPSDCVRCCLCLSAGAGLPQAKVLPGAAEVLQQRQFGWPFNSCFDQFFLTVQRRN
jgi:hypothetical protein